MASTKTVSAAKARKRAGHGAAAVLLALLAAGCDSVTSRGILGDGLTSQGREAVVQTIPATVDEFGGPYSDVNLQRYVQTLVDVLVRASGSPDWTIKAILLNSPAVNVFSMPTREILVTRGMLAALNNEAELAGVLAHQIAMINNGSITRQFEAARLQSPGVRAHAMLVPGTVLARMTRFLAAPHLVPFDPQLTVGADPVAVRMMANAGYDPAALSTALSALQRSSSVEAADQSIEPGVDPLHYTTLYGREERVLVDAIRKTELKPATPLIADREVYLQSIDGLPVDHDSRFGTVDGRTYRNVAMGFAIDVPPGFRVVPFQDLVVARGPSGTGLAMDVIRVDQLPRLPIYVTEVFGRQFVNQGVMRGLEPIKVNGKDGATASARLETSAGPVDYRLVVVRFAKDRLVRMVFVSPGDLTQTLSLDYRRTGFSLRELAPGEAQQLPPRRVQIVRPGFGETFEVLAARMPYRTLQLERLFALNGLAPGAEIAPAESLKTVRR
ncbi:MAG: M48 family metalloprotease [Alphaproteobacteria bacterium]|nr:M48 family metalloprotease [Alphaproteobacteria bacterium]